MLKTITIIFGIMIMINRTEKLFCDFLAKMQVELNNERIKQYLFMIEGFEYNCIQSVLDIWSRKNVHRYIPSPDTLLELLIAENKKIDNRTSPQTRQDLFGNRVRCETSLSRELRKLLKQVINGELKSDNIDDKILEVEKKHGFVPMPIVPIRKTPEQCVYDSGVNEYEVKRAFNKQHKGEEDLKVLNDLAKALIPWGHTLFRAHEKLEYLSIDDDVWRETFDVLVEYGK